MKNELNVTLGDMNESTGAVIAEKLIKLGLRPKELIEIMKGFDKQVAEHLVAMHADMQKQCDAIAHIMNTLH